MREAGPLRWQTSQIERGKASSPYTFEQSAATFLRRLLLAFLIILMAFGRYSFPGKGL